MGKKRDQAANENRRPTGNRKRSGNPDRGTYLHKYAGRRAKGETVRVRSGRFEPKIARFRKRPYLPEASFGPLPRINAAAENAVLYALQAGKAKRSVRELAVLTGFTESRRPVDGVRFAASVVRSLRDQGLIERKGGRFRIRFDRRPDVARRLYPDKSVSGVGASLIA